MIKSILAGIRDGVTRVTLAIRKNQASTIGGEGSIDVLRLYTNLIVKLIIAGIVIGVITGRIPVEILNDWLPLIIGN